MHQPQRPDWIVITEVTSISTLEWLIVDYQTLTIIFFVPPFLGRRHYCKWYLPPRLAFHYLRLDDSGYVKSR